MLFRSAQGVWFVKDTNGYRGKGDEKASYNNHGKVAHGYWDTHLALAPDAVDPKSFIYSIGDWEGCPCQFMSIGNVDPSTVKSDGQPTVVDLVEYSQVAPDGSPMDPTKPVKGYTLKAGTTIVGSVAFQVNSDGTIRNGYTIKILNMKQEPRSFRVGIEGLPGATMASEESAEAPTGAIIVAAEADKLRAIKIFVSTNDPEARAEEATRFTFVVTELSTAGDAETGRYGAIFHGEGKEEQ
mgnify:CR=1 FL=1